jgi:hypothetical protein
MRTYGRYGVDGALVVFVDSELLAADLDEVPLSSSKS